jgi:hypothetical protein
MPPPAVRAVQAVLEIVATSAVAAGHEVHNTYGELGNAELAGKYGFALRHNPFTTVALEKQERVDAGARLALGLGAGGPGGEGVAGSMAADARHQRGEGGEDEGKEGPPKKKARVKRTAEQKKAEREERRRREAWLRRCQFLVDETDVLTDGEEPFEVRGCVGVWVGVCVCGGGGAGLTDGKEPFEVHGCGWVGWEGGGG